MSGNHINALVRQIRAAVSDIAPLVDAKALEIYGGGSEASEAWIFAFCLLTNEAILLKDAQRVESCLKIMHDHYVAGSSSARDCVAGYYVQHLLAGLNSLDKAWGWDRFPADFRLRYVEVCGEPGSVRFENS
jgi:hypothetical protein